MCSCEPENKSVLVRYNMDELNTLVQALERRLDAIELWASKDSGFCSSNRRQHNLVKLDSERDGLEMDPSMKNEGLSGSLIGQNHNAKKQCSSLHSEHGDKSNGTSTSLAIQEMHDGIKVPTERAGVILVCDSGSSVSQATEKNLRSCSDDATTSYASNHSSGKKLFDVDLSMCSPSVRQNGTFDSEKDYWSSGISEQKLGYHVDPLNLGSIASGNPWCNKQAIFPKGFRSRVVRNPVIASSYICEILDGGLLGPLFKVSSEDCPDTSFACSSGRNAGKWSHKESIKLCHHCNLMWKASTGSECLGYSPRR